MQNVSLIVYQVADIDAAKRFFRELVGSDPYVEGPPYVGYKSGDMEIGLVPAKGGRSTPALPYWTVSDIRARVNALVAAGGTIVQEVKDVAYGLLVASVRDTNGATVGLRQFPEG